MKKIILLSAERFTADLYVKELQIKNPKILFIITASFSKEGEKPWLTEAQNSFRNLGCVVDEYDIRDKSIENFRSEVQNYDVIHFAGGHPQYLLYYIKKTGFDIFLEELDDSIIISGASAGAVVLSQSIGSSLPWEGVLKECPLDSYLGLEYINFEILPHYGKEKYVEQQIECVKNSMNSNYNLLCLRDDSIIVVENENFKIIKN